MTRSTSRLLFPAIALLLIGIALVTYGDALVPAPKFNRQLKDLLPPAPQGWSMKEKSIADSPEMKKAVGELLNYDDAIFVDYVNSSNERISVYMAYWTPGKMSHRLIATHTPDVCWVGAGWVQTKKATLAEMPLLATTAEKNLQPSPAFTLVGEDRIYTSQGTPEYVWFWHLVGDHSKSYATGAEPPWNAALLDLFQNGLNQREEQFFIRISSNRPLETFTPGPITSALLNQIPWPVAKKQP